MSELKAGRELDALIAEKVMGQVDLNHPIIYREEMRNRDGWLGDKVHCPKCGTFAIGDETEEPIVIDNLCVQSYSTDLQSAWQVYEWLEARGLVSVSNGDGDSKDCDFTPLQAWAHLYSAHVSADSYPLAICLTALRAVE